MLSSLHSLMYMIVLAPLLGAVIAGLFAKSIGQRGAHYVTIAGMLVATVASWILAARLLSTNVHVNFNAFTWLTSGRYSLHVGFLIDQLTALMLVTVSTVSLLVHVYSIGYMRGDSGYQRFFSYMSLFTFFMLMLASANNFLQLFFGWEGVGLVSYLLIGFWFEKESAAAGSLKAFIVNRIGDFGLILGLALVFDHVGSLDYSHLIAALPVLKQQSISIIPGYSWSLVTVICVCLFVGAMGKSAQIPLHVWLPESMEGPTPISALIHAATMVTAGVFMVARLSPMYELSTPALSMILIIGASGALFLGLLAVVENDIKRVIAYSTMSQLGYMMAANGASAYQAGIFHLVTHACFKALLFLAAGSVIVALHHMQDLRKMGGLRRALPWTYVTFLIGALALAAIPPFSGLYSKDAIIEAVGYSSIPGATYAYDCLLFGAFVTSWYIFRAFFLAFHGPSRLDAKLQGKISEPAWSMRLPLILLALPSVFLGAVLAVPMLYQHPDLLGSAVYVSRPHDVWQLVAHSMHSPWHIALASLGHLPFWFAVAGIFYAYMAYVLYPELPARLLKYCAWGYRLLRFQYGFDWFNQLVFVNGTRRVSEFFYRITDVKLIDGVLVNGAARSITRLSRVLRTMQSGYLYHYVLVMLCGVLVFLGWLIFGR